MQPASVCNTFKCLSINNKPFITCALAQHIKQINNRYIMLYREKTNGNETIPGACRAQRGGRARRARRGGRARRARRTRMVSKRRKRRRYVILAAAANCLYGQPYVMLDVFSR